MVIWAGLVWVKHWDKSKAGPLDGGDGAYVNVISPATSTADFEHRVIDALQIWNLDTLEFEDVEPLPERAKRAEIPLLLLSLAEQCEADGRVRCGTLFVFENEPEPEE